MDFLSQWTLTPTAEKLIIVGVGVTVIAVLVRLLKRPLAGHIDDKDARYRVRKLVTFVGYGAVALLVAAVFSDRLGGLAVVLGVAGAGVAFALQEVIASIAGWLAVSFGGFYSVGDRVQLGGIQGDVIDVGILRTTVMEMGSWISGDQYNGRVVRIANSFVFKEPVFNYSGDFPFLWDEIKIPVKYGSDYRLARKVLEDAAAAVVGDFVPHARAAWEGVVRKYRVEDARLEPMVLMMANDNWVEFTLRYVVDFKKRRTAKDELFTRILDEFEGSEGRVAVASATVHIVDVPPLDVNVSGR
ncbi:MAG: mechanosensitive ion channel [Candidatus Zixiibacteriota bacterium]|jgi:small-conductance mechanosensitive channel